MKALSIPASRSGKSVNFPAILAAVRHSLTARALNRFALFCAIVVYISLIFNAVTVMYTSGIVAILAMWASDSLQGKKGGRR